MIQDGEARLWSRTERDLGKRFDVLVDAIRSFLAQSAILDGEVVILGEDANHRFRTSNISAHVWLVDCYYAFDLLH